KVVAPATKGGRFSLPEGRLYGFIYTGGAAAHRNPRAIGASNLRTLGAKAPSIFRTFSILLDIFLFR
ncbi:MAG: hypothetical protein UDQ48_04205, partial [Dialister sp.]|uniref:hypothetical protein n=1 Tax=Dialister sp. TaxID=1955814 RepID=UPI002E7A487E